jgi:demethylmenaquinone methyltransferase/2-methoxy-6-polyprenyl-1,4-benzoquinol methylase
MSPVDPNMKPHPVGSPAIPVGPVTSPHAPLSGYYRDDADRQQYVSALFDRTAAHYDRIERILSFGSGPWYRRDALRRAGVGRGSSVLDVGCGTGLLAAEALRLVGPGGRLVGVDPSPGMMAQARLAESRLLEGIAEALPVEDQSFDFVTMGYALRHIGNLQQAFREFRRVLRPGGTVLVLEITRPANRVGAAALKAYMHGVGPLVARAVARERDTPALWRYFWDTIEACVPPQRVLDTLLDAGFTRVRREVTLGIFSEYLGVCAAGGGPATASPASPPSREDPAAREAAADGAATGR